MQPPRFGFMSNLTHPLEFRDKLYVWVTQRDEMRMENVEIGLILYHTKFIIVLEKQL